MKYPVTIITSEQKDIVITQDEMDEFIKNPLWIKLQLFLKERRFGFFESLRMAKDLETIKNIQGKIDELEYLYMLPTKFFEEAKEESKRKEAENESAK